MNHSANRIGSHVTIPSCGVVNGLIIDQRDLDTELMVEVKCHKPTDQIGLYIISEWYRLPIVGGEIPEDYATFTD